MHFGVFCWLISPLILKTLPIEEIYTDPHKLDSYLDSGETVAVMRGGRTVAEFVPLKEREKVPAERPSIDYKARFLKMWGPEAFTSGVSIAEEFAELRADRVL